MKPVLIYIDEEPRAQDLFSRRLQKAVGDEVEVIAVPPEQTLDEMVEKIEQKSNLYSIVIDQKLFAAGTAQYLGTDLAKSLRLADQLVPIYILTNHVDDVDSSLGSIEYVLSKDDLGDSDKLATIGMRVRRHMNVFKSILDEREVRFEALLRKRFDESLTEEEYIEYKKLKYHREKLEFSATFIDSDELTKKMDEAEAKLREIEIKLGFRE